MHTKSVSAETLSAYLHRKSVALQFMCIALFAFLSGCETADVNEASRTEQVVPIVPEPLSDDEFENEMYTQYTASSNFDDVIIQVHNFRGVVLLTGQVLSESQKTQASSMIVFGNMSYKILFNEIEVVAKIDKTVLTEDEGIKALVNDQLSRADFEFIPDISVEVHSQTVYFLGVLSAEKNSMLEELYAQLRGVKKIKSAIVIEI